MAVNMLTSYGLNPSDNLATYRAAMPCGRIMIDSGAYTAYTVGKVIRLDEYAEYLERWKGSWDHAVTLDVIGDPKATRANTHKLHRRGIPVMPVFTRGDTPADFDAMVKESGYVCVGGGVGMPEKVAVKRLAALQRRAEELGGGIHALGVGGMNALRRIRPYSADSSNIAGAFRYGYLICYEGQRFYMMARNDHTKIRRHLVAFKSQGVSLAEIVRTHRQPMGRDRMPLMHTLAIGGVCADEDTAKFQVPTPAGINDTPGTHMYHAITGGFLAPAFTELDTLIHEGWTVPMWERYKDAHTAHNCRQEARAA